MPTICPVRLAKLPEAKSDMFACDVTFVGDNLPIAAWQPHDRGYGRMAIDLAVLLARAARQRLGEVRRLDVAILWVLDCAYDPINVAKRPDILDVLRVRHLTSIPPIVAATPA